MPATLDHALFYDSENSDRAYDATSFEYWLKKFFTTGVFVDDLAVTASGDGMSVVVAPGYCNIDGKVRIFEQSQELNISTAHGTYSRIDNIVIERNDTERDITIKVVNGTNASSPTAPVPVRANGVYQLVIAQVEVGAGVTRIYQRNVTDTRQNDSLCGIVVAAVQTPSFSTLYKQYTDRFNVWFDQMKDQLSTDAAGNLQRQIDTKADDVPGRQMSEQNYTLAEKVKLASLQNYTHPTGNGYRHIPAGGSAGQILRWNSAGEAAWGADRDTVYTHPTTSGNKHIPAGGSSNQILRWGADGTANWSNERTYTLNSSNGNVLGLSYNSSTKTLAITLKNSAGTAINSGTIQQKEYSLA